MFLRESSLARTLEIIYGHLEIAERYVYVSGDKKKGLSKIIERLKIVQNTLDSDFFLPCLLGNFQTNKELGRWAQVCKKI